MRYSPVLAQSRASVDAARANVEITDAAFRPTIQGNESFQAFSSQTGFAGTPTGGRFPVLPVRGFGPGSQDFNVAEAQLKWTVFQFGKQIARHGQAVLRTEIAEFQLTRSCQSVAFEVGQAYFRVLEAKAAVEIAERAVERAEAFLAESASLLRRRRHHPRGTPPGRGAGAAARQERTDARSEEEVAVAGLNRTMGIDVNAPTRVAERRRAPGIDMPLEATLKVAVANRPEIPVMVRGIAVAQGDVKIARADYLPTVSVQAGYSNVSGTHIQNSNVAAGGIFVTQELYGGGRRRGQLLAAEAGVRSAIAQAQQVCDGIAYEVNVAFHGVEDARERIRAARATFEQASEYLRLVTSRFRTGDATPAELMEAPALGDGAPSRRTTRPSTSTSGRSCGWSSPSGPSCRPRGRRSRCRRSPVRRHRGRPAARRRSDRRAPARLPGAAAAARSRRAPRPSARLPCRRLLCPGRPERRRCSGHRPCPGRRMKPTRRSAPGPDPGPGRTPAPLNRDAARVHGAAEA